MLNLNFNTLQEFEELFSYSNQKIVDGVYNGINEGYLFSKKTVKLFSISFRDEEICYEISLPNTDWARALDVCLKFYEENGTQDECIDTWKLKDNIEKFHSK